MKHLQKFYLFTLYIMGTTIIHHFYGALIYPQKFRIYTSLFAIPITLGEYYLFMQYEKTKKKFWLFVFQAMAILIPLMAIGMFEGGYNHVLKNILYFTGASSGLLSEMFPPSAYEMPDNFIFEFTGILQFGFTVIALVFLVKYYIASWTERILSSKVKS